MAYSSQRTRIAGRGAFLCFLFTITLLAWGICRWSIAIDQPPLTWDGIRCALQLLIACGVLTLLGSAIIRLVARWCHREALAPLLDYISPLAGFIIALVIGQIGSIVWILFRSGSNALSFGFIGLRLPVSLIEVVVIVLGSIVVIAKTPPPILTRGENNSRKRSFSSCIVLLAALCIPIALRELPRDTTLSSDPDQHAFYARQVLRLGAIPWDQGIYGPEHFHYPGGFGALNAIWTLFSGLSVVEIATVQPMIQFLLMAALCASFAPLLLRSFRKPRETAPENGSTLALTLGLFVAYWFFLPYGYQHDVYHGEGTARASTTLLLSFVFLSWIGVPKDLRTPRTTTVWLAALMFSTVSIATFNPLSAICPIILVSGISLYELGRSLLVTILRRVSATAAPVPHILALGVASIFLLCSDPYFGEKIFKRHSVPHALEVLDVSSTQAPQATEPYVKLPSEPILERFYPLQHVSFFFAGTVPLAAIPTDWYCILAAMMAIWLLYAPKIALRYVALGPLLSFCFVLALSVPPKNIAEPPLYLFQPYLIRAVLQAGAVGAFCLVAVSINALAAERSWVRSALAVALVLRFTWYPAHSFASSNPIFNMKPRATHPGSLGGITEGDREAIAFIKTFGASVLSKYGDLSHDEAPKILIPSHPTDLGFEKWLFPIGASRLVPLESPLPVAFFYGQGSRLWSYDNYRQHVCLQFDKEWLKKRNIRYVFIPKSNPGCIRGKQALLAESKILFEKDETRVIQIF